MSLARWEIRTFGALGMLVAASMVAMDNSPLWWRVIIAASLLGTAARFAFARIEA